MASLREVVDEKREEFRFYLERGNVMMTVSRALVSLYDEYTKPDDPVEYLRKALGDRRPTSAEMEAALELLKESEATLEDLRRRNDWLRGRLLSLDPDSELLAQPRAGDFPEGDALPTASTSAAHANDEVNMAPPPSPMTAD